MENLAEKQLRRAVVEVIYIYCYGEEAQNTHDKRIAEIIQQLDEIRLRNSP